MEQDSNDNMNSTIFTAEQQAKLKEVQIRKKALETQLNLISQEETMLRDKLQEENQEKDRIKQEIDNLRKIKETLKDSTPRESSDLRQSTMFSQETQPEDQSSTMKQLLDKEISSLELRLNEIDSRSGISEFIVSFDSKKLYKLIVQDHKISQLKYFVSKNDFIGVIKSEIWHYFKKENINGTKSRFVGAGTVFDQFEVLEENYHSNKTQISRNKLYFKSKWNSICVIEKQENRIRYSKFEFEFEKDLFLITDDGASTYCTDDGNTVYRFDQGKHSNEAYFRNDHFGLNAELADKIAILFKDKVCFFNKSDLKKTRTFVHNCHPETKTKLRIIGETLAFIANKGMFCLFNVKGTRIAQLEVNAVNFDANNEYFAVLCKKQLILVDTLGNKLDEIELGTKIPKNIHLF